MKLINEFNHPARALFFLLVTLLSCSATTNDTNDNGKKIKVIFDTDANNELDDQHALAYLLFNGDKFDIRGITVNATHNGGNIDGHVKEAERVLQLCNSFGKIPLVPGANDNFITISEDLNNTKFDGWKAVNFIIQEARKNKGEKLNIVAVGKLTNLALALKIDETINSKIKIIWLGSNYPDPGEYNLNDDIEALNFVLSSNVEFEIVVVRYNARSGAGAVKATLSDIRKIMPAKGPHVEKAVEGRHGQLFNCFGDYSVDLFNHIGEYLTDSSRAMFDMTAVAILKNPSWGKVVEMPAPYYSAETGGWVQRKDNKRKVKYHEQFNQKAIMDDFYKVMLDYRLPD